MALSSKDTTHKRKIANESEKEPAAGKKKGRLSKTMSKKNSTELLEALRTYSGRKIACGGNL